MADRKEVLDYLRNQQKAAEIEAQMNGINVWVLLGAIAVVGWQLTSTPAAKLWNDYELIARTLVASVALHMLSWLIRKPSGERDELRYSKTDFSEMDSPFLVLLWGVLIFLPPAALWQIAGKSFAAIVLCLLGAAFIFISAIAILKPLAPAPRKRERFPKPEFGLTRRADVASDLILGIFFMVVLGQQIAHFRSAQDALSIDNAKSMVLLAVFYLLLLITVNRKQQNDSIAWTYELETDLVLGTISPEVATRKIENRRLGPRLQDIVDRFFDEMDQRFREVESRMADCAAKIRAAKEVPEEYPAERAARLRTASEDIADRIDALAADCKEFREYLARLEQKPGRGRKAVLAPVLGSLKARQGTYDERIQAAKSRLEQLLN